jgi:rubrerythrin
MPDLDTSLKRRSSFETRKDVLDWYERQDRVLTDEFIREIPWDRVNDHEVDERFIPVLLYMRDVETLTDMYHRELSRTPTGKDPHISKFMERWGVEEITHGEVLNRFLNEAGYETPNNWQDEVRRSVPRSYHRWAYLVYLLGGLVGERFTATHMTFGAIHEMEAAQGYRRLMELAAHPVLTHVLQGIIREESVHAQFYRSIARLELGRSRFARKMARWVVDHFWEPVGASTLSPERSDNVIRTLFAREEALAGMDKTVTQRVSQLPGLDGITRMTDRIGTIARSGLPEFDAI